MNMQFNEEPMGGRDPLNPPFLHRLPGLAQQGAQMVGQGIQAIQQAQDPLSSEEAMRQLRMERARQAYERRFGMQNPAGASLASQGSQEGVDYLLERIKRARADGTYKTGNYKRRA
jgi:carbamoylphosphate synthase large subunit